MPIACTVPALVPWVQRLSEASPAAAAAADLLITGSAAACTLVCDAAACGPATGPGAAYERLVSRVSFALVDGFDSGLALHAGCVVRGRTCVVVAGVSGAGKTTSTAWLLGRGYDYLTDELVFVPLAGSPVRGWARPLHVKRGAWDLVAAQQRGPQPRPTLRYPGGGFMLPESFGAAVVAEATPTHLLFVHYAAGAASRVVPLRAAQAATRLVRHLVNGRNLPDHGVPALIAWCRGVQAYDVHYADLETVRAQLDL